MEHAGDRRSVLLVEDEVLVRLTLADDLRRAGLTVLEAANADEASTVLETHPDWVGVLLTDIQMPGLIDGRGLVRFARQRFPDVKVVVLSGLDARMLADVQADAVLSKPHAPEAIVRLINQLLQGRTSNGSRNTNAGMR